MEELTNILQKVFLIKSGQEYLLSTTSNEMNAILHFSDRQKAVDFAETRCTDMQYEIKEVRDELEISKLFTGLMHTSNARLFVIDPDPTEERWVRRLFLGPVKER